MERTHFAANISIAQHWSIATPELLGYSESSATRAMNSIVETGSIKGTAPSRSTDSDWIESRNTDVFWTPVTLHDYVRFKGRYQAPGNPDGTQ